MLLIFAQGRSMVSANPGVAERQGEYWGPVHGFPHTPPDTAFSPSWAWATAKTTSASLSVLGASLSSLSMNVSVLFACRLFCFLSPHLAFIHLHWIPLRGHCLILNRYLSVCIYPCRVCMCVYVLCMYTRTHTHKSLFLALSRYNWHLTWCKFKVYDALICYTHILQNRLHHSVS